MTISSCLCVPVPTLETLSPVHLLDSHPVHRLGHIHMISAVAHSAHRDGVLWWHACLPLSPQLQRPCMNLHTYTQHWNHYTVHSKRPYIMNILYIPHVLAGIWLLLLHCLQYRRVAHSFTWVIKEQKGRVLWCERALEQQQQGYLVTLSCVYLSS